MADITRPTFQVVIWRFLMHLFEDFAGSVYQDADYEHVDQDHCYCYED